MGNNFRFLAMIGAAIMSRAGYALPQAPKQHAGLSREQQSIILQKAAAKRERRNARRATEFHS